MRLRPFQAMLFSPSCDLAGAVHPTSDIDVPDIKDASNIDVRRLIANDTGATSYETAAKTLDRWIEDGTVLIDPAPCLYTYRIDSAAGPVDSLVGMVDPGWWNDTLLPHEHVSPEAVEARVRHLHDTGLQAAPIMLIADIELPPPDHTIVRSVPDRGHEISRSSLDALEVPWAVVADGHHRAEAAVALGAPLLAMVIPMRTSALTLVAREPIDDDLDIETVVGRARAGRRLSGKSTSFGPKPVAGLIMARRPWT